MPENLIENSGRIAKNTVLLYIRMLFVMAVGFVASRVVLQALGVTDFGIYNAVGGFVALFGVVSQSLSNAAARFITFEMGKGDPERLGKVFSATLVIHLSLAVVVFLLLEGIGLWFIHHKMVIPAERMAAAIPVFHCSVLAFIVALVTVPWHACIIAHEKMNVFAAVGIFDGLAKLAVCYLLYISPLDRLVFYAILQLAVQVVSRGLFVLYAQRHFQECGFRLFSSDRGTRKEIFHFAGWTFIGISSAILRDQGGTVLLNLFCGPVANAARAVATQVQNAVQGFSNNFLTALRPQITKSYASGGRDYMMSLIFYGSRLSFYLLFFLCLPILLNTDVLLRLWLKTVPEHSAAFVRLTLVFAMVEAISQTLITAQQATGKVRNYQLIVGGLQLLNLPVSYLMLRWGYPPEVVLYVSIAFACACFIARLVILRRNDIHLDSAAFLKKVILNILAVSAVAAAIPVFLRFVMDDSPMSCLVSILVSLVCSALSVLFVGFNRKERHTLLERAGKAFRKPSAHE